MAREIEVARETSARPSPEERARTGNDDSLNPNTALSHAPDFELSVPNLDGTLYPFQRATVAYCLRNKQVIVGEPTGSGKTVIVLAVLAATDAVPVIGVVPKSMMPVWKTETERFTSLSVQALGRTDDPIRPKDLVLVSYGQLSYDGSQNKTALAKRLCDFSARSIFADEAHALRGDSLRSNLFEAIAEPSEYRMLLTGTPVVKNTHDLNRLVSILDQDIYLPDDPEKVNQTLRSTCYVRHERDIILSDLPERHRRPVRVSIDNRRDYSRLEDKYFQELSRRAGFKALYEFRRTAALGKLSYIEELAEDLSEPLALFVIHRDVQRELIERFPSASLVISDLSSKRRQEEIESFQSGHSDIIICAIGSTPEQSPGGVGIELTRASHGIFCELGWTHAHLWQAGNRIHRLGQEDPVTLWFPIAEATIDEAVWDLIQERKLLTEEATDGITDPNEILQRL